MVICQPKFFVMIFIKINLSFKTYKMKVLKKLLLRIYIVAFIVFFYIKHVYLLTKIIYMLDRTYWNSVPRILIIKCLSSTEVAKIIWVCPGSIFGLWVCLGPRWLYYPPPLSDLWTKPTLYSCVLAVDEGRLKSYSLCNSSNSEQTCSIVTALRAQN